MIQFKHDLTYLAVIGMMAVPTPSMAQEADTVCAVAYAEADADGNGVITPNEAPDGLIRAYDRIDTDGDGIVSAAEYESCGTAPAATEAAAAETPAELIPAAAGETSDEALVVLRDPMEESGVTLQLDPQIALQQISPNPSEAEETPEELAEKFGEIDSDGSGEVSDTELAAYRDATQAGIEETARMARADSALLPVVLYRRDGQ